MQPFLLPQEPSDLQNVESKRHARCISLPKDNYENNASYLPLFDRARSRCVRPNPNSACYFGICSAQPGFEWDWPKPSAGHCEYDANRGGLRDARNS